MALLKKINSDWSPSENRGLKVGETIDLDSYETLVRQGKAVLVDEAGRELPLPGTVFTCPICYAGLKTIDAFTAHIETTHNPKFVAPVQAEKITTEPEIKEAVKAVPEVKEEVVLTKAEQAAIEVEKESFGEKMRKAREEAKKKHEEGK